MNANAVISEIEKMPAEEREKVFAYVEAALLAQPESPATEPSVLRDDARAIRKRIFQTNAELLRKLAQ